MYRKIYSGLAALVFICLSTACTLRPKSRDLEKDNIRDAYWVLMSVEGQDVRLMNDTRTAYIRFEEGEDDVSGFTGCNRISGHYTLEGAQLQLSKLSTTRMACTDMDTEKKLMEVLRRVNTYRLSGDVLTLLDGNTAVATFMTGNPELMRDQVEDKLHIEITD